MKSATTCSWTIHVPSRLTKPGQKIHIRSSPWSTHALLFIVWLTFQITWTNGSESILGGYGGVALCLEARLDGHVESVGGSFCSVPPNFPTTLLLQESNYKNWVQQIELRNVWTVSPKTSYEIVTLANWAKEHGWKLRPTGFMHNWSPLVVTGKEGPCSRIILVDTKALKKMEMMAEKHGEAAVRVEAGASLESLLTFLERNGKGILGHPAPGDITIAGALAIGGHGTGLPLRDHGFNHGTLSNLVKSFKAVTWDEGLRSFKIQTFDRTDPEAEVFILSLGRMFLVEVTLLVSPLVNLRCTSHTDISSDSLFADPTKEFQRNVTLSSYIEAGGAVAVIWFPFTSNPWLKVWSVTPHKPIFSRRTTHPYNYAFSDNIPLELNDVASKLVRGNWNLAPLFGNLQLTATVAGLFATYSTDLWGPSKNLLLYVKPTTLRLIVNGYVMLTHRANIQFILHRFTTFYQDLIQSYANRALYPINGPMEIRVTGIDDKLVPGSSPPVLSPLKPVQGHPEFDTAIWIDFLIFPNTPYAPEFFTKVEDFLMNKFSSKDAFLRPEWSKGFAYTNPGGAWSNRPFLAEFIPRAFGRDWEFALHVFNKYDPHQVFTNEFLRRLFLFHHV